MLHTISYLGKKKVINCLPINIYDTYYPTAPPALGELLSNQGFGIFTDKYTIK